MLSALLCASILSFFSKSAAALASAYDELALHRDRAEAMGRNARSLALELDLSWDRVIRELTR